MSALKMKDNDFIAISNVVDIAVVFPFCENDRERTYFALIDYSANLNSNTHCSLTFLFPFCAHPEPVPSIFCFAFVGTLGKF